MNTFAKMLSDTLAEHPFLFRLRVSNAMIHGKFYFIIRNVGNLSEPDSDQYAKVVFNNHKAIIEPYADSLKKQIQLGEIVLSQEMSGTDFVLMARFGKSYSNIMDSFNVVPALDGVETREARSLKDPFSPIVDAIQIGLVRPMEIKVKELWVPYYEIRNVDPMLLLNLENLEHILVCVNNQNELIKWKFRDKIK